MKQTQTDWLLRLDADVVAQGALNQREMQKQALIGKLASDREKKRNTIGQGSDLLVKNKKGDKQRTLDYKNHDQTEEFDLDEQRDGYRIANALGKIEEWDPVNGTQEQFQKHLETGRIVDQMVLEMETAMTDELDADGNPVYPLGEDGQPLPGAKANQKRLFSDEDIATEVYDPMRRRGLIPETSIPDKFSRTKEMLDGSFDAYAERLKADKKSLGKRMFDENFALVKTLGTSSFSLAGSGVLLQSAGGSTGDELATSWKPEDNIKSLKTNLGEIPKDNGSFAGAIDIANTRMGFAGQALTFVMDVGYEGRKDIKERFGGKVAPVVLERMSSASQIALGLIGAASTELSQPFSGSGLGMEICSTLGTVVDRGAITKLLSAEDFPAGSVTAIAGLLGAACKATLLKLDPELEGSTALLGTAGEAVKSALAAKPDAAKVLEAFSNGKLEVAVELYRSALAAAAASAAKAELVALLEKPAAKDKVMTKAAAAMDEAFNRKEEDPVPPEQIEDHKSILGHEPRWVKGGGGWVCSVCESTNTEDPAIFAGIMEAKIAALKRDQALLKWGATLVGLGIDTAANFIAPLAIAGCALKMAKNLFEAGKRTRDMIKFIDDRQGMFNAASAFSAPVSQFIHNAAIQQAHYYANAAFEAAKMIGAIIQCSGAMAAPAGVIVSASAGIAQAVEAVLYEAAKRLDLEVAWSAYKLALSRPENRKLGLIALKRNPTLAKYAVAWGAVIKQDPLVADFMGSCGLTAESLKDPAADIGKVVEYLETRMPDDNVVTGRTVSGPAASWAPAEIHLTAKSWLDTKSRGEGRGGLEAQDTRSFESGLLKLEASLPAWRTAGTAQPSSTLTLEQYKACSDQLGSLHILLIQVRTVLKKEAGGGDSVEMEDVKIRFRKMISDLKNESLDWNPEEEPVEP